MPSVVHDVLHRPIVDGETVLWIHAGGYLEPLRYNGRKFICLGFHNNIIVRRLVSPRVDASYIKISREQLADALIQRTLETSASFVWHNFSSIDQRALAAAFIPLCATYLNETDNSLPHLMVSLTPVPTGTMTIQTEQGTEELQIRKTNKTKTATEVELDFD